MDLPRLPPKQLFTTESGTLEYVLAGEGPPTYLLFNGAGVLMEGWGRVFPDLVRQGRVFAWNRFGVGRSSPPTLPQTGTVVVDTLRQVLQGLDVQPPYVLVGHSLGGLHAQLFARRFPDEVAGVVLIEATHPRDREMLKGHEGHLAKVLSNVMSMPQRLFRRNLHSEVDWIDAAAREVESAGPFPQVPLVVITGGKQPPKWLVPEEAVRIKRGHQEELARLSASGRHVVAGTSGHFPQLTEPQVVARELRQVAQDCHPV